MEGCSTDPLITIHVSLESISAVPVSISNKLFGSRTFHVSRTDQLVVDDVVPATCMVVGEFGSVYKLEVPLEWLLFYALYTQQWFQCRIPSDVHSLVCAWESVELHNYDGAEGRQSGILHWLLSIDKRNDIIHSLQQVVYQSSLYGHIMDEVYAVLMRTGFSGWNEITFVAVVYMAGRSFGVPMWNNLLGFLCVNAKFSDTAVCVVAAVLYSVHMACMDSTTVFRPRKCGKQSVPHLFPIVIAFDPSPDSVQLAISSLRETVYCVLYVLTRSTTLCSRCSLAFQDQMCCSLRSDGEEPSIYAELATLDLQISGSNLEEKNEKLVMHFCPIHDKVAGVYTLDNLALSVELHRSVQCITKCVHNLRTYAYGMNDVTQMQESSDLLNEVDTLISTVVACILFNEESV
jgi:hypothetical protein